MILSCLSSGNGTFFARPVENVLVGDYVAPVFVSPQVRSCSEGPDLSWPVQGLSAHTVLPLVKF
jgi:hypothetical protein